MSMLQQILAQTMQRAAGKRAASNGPKQIDPREKIQINELIKASKETTDPKELEIIYNQMDKLGIPSDWRREMSGIETQEERIKKQNIALYSEIIKRIAPQLVSQATAPTPEPQPPPAGVEQLATPTQRMKTQETINGTVYDLAVPKPITEPAARTAQPQISPPAVPTPKTTSLTGAETVISDNIAERATLNIHADGKFSISLGPVKKKTAKEIAENELLTGPERRKFLNWQKRKLMGDETEVHFVANEVTGITSMLLINKRGEVVETFQYKTDLPAEQKRQQALDDKIMEKFTTVDTGVSEITGKPYKTISTPTGEMATVEGTTQLKETAAEKRAAEREQKLTENIVKVDEKGDLVLIPVVAGKMGKEQKGIKIKDVNKLKKPTSETSDRMTALKNVSSAAEEVTDVIDNKLASAGFTLNDMTGPLEGRYREVMSKWVNTPEYEELRASLSKLIPVVYGLTGKQLNEWELKWLRDEVIPSLKQPEENFLVRFKNFKDWLQTRRVNDAVANLQKGEIPVSSEDIMDTVKAEIKKYKPLPKTSEDIYKQEEQPVNDADAEFNRIMSEFKKGKE